MWYLVESKGTDSAEPQEETRPSLLEVVKLLPISELCASVPSSLPLKFTWQKYDLQLLSGFSLGKYGHLGLPPFIIPFLSITNV